MKSIFTTAIVAATLSVSITSCIADEALNTECDILTCTLPEGVLMSSPTITNDRVTLMALPDADISKLAPEFTITEGATITPASGSLQDFLNAENHTVVYTVTSQDGAWHKDYRVEVIQRETTSEYKFNKVELDATKKYSIFNEADDEGNNLMTWASGNPGFIMCGMADKEAKAAYGNDYKSHIWEFFPTIAVYPEGTEQIVDEKSGVTYFMKDGKYAQPEYIRLVTRSTGAFGSRIKMPIAAGNIFQGWFDLSYATSRPREATQFGEPFRYKPLSLSGTYRFTPGEVFTNSDGKEVPDRQDIFSIYAIFFKSDADTEFIDSNVHYNDFQHPNMVALANLTDCRVTGLGDDAWVDFKIPFVYYDGVTIDYEALAKGQYKIGIVIASSAEGDYFRGAVGSTLDVKNIRVIHEKTEE